MTIYEVLALELFNLLCLIIGVSIGQKTAKNKEIKLNPVSAIKKDIEEKKEEKKQELKQRQIDTMLYNIDNYNGDGLGQRDIPKE